MFLRIHKKENFMIPEPCIMMEIHQISQDFKIWEVLVIWVVLATWEEIKTLSFLLMGNKWEEWVELTPIKFFLCLWEEEKEDSAVLETSDKEENPRKISKIKGQVMVLKILVVFHLMTLMISEEDSAHLEETFINKRIDNKSDSLIFSMILIILRCCYFKFLSIRTKSIDDYKTKL